MAVSSKLVSLDSGWGRKRFRLCVAASRGTDGLFISLLLFRNVGGDVAHSRLVKGHARERGSGIASGSPQERLVSHMAHDLKHPTRRGSARVPMSNDRNYRDPQFSLCKIV